MQAGLHIRGAPPEIINRPSRLVHSGPWDLAGAAIEPGHNAVCTNQYTGNYVFASTNYTAAKAYAFKQNGNTLTTFSLDKPVLPVIINVDKESYLQFLQEQNQRGYQYEFNANQFEEVLKRNEDGSRERTGEWISDLPVQKYKQTTLNFGDLLTQNGLQVFFLNIEGLEGEKVESRIQELIELKIHSLEGLRTAVDKGWLIHYNTQLKEHDPDVKTLNLNTGAIS